MSRSPVYDAVEYTGRTFKRLTNDEADRVRAKVKALQDKTLLRPDLQDVFELCDDVILTLMSNRIDCAVVPRLKVLFDEHAVR
jgi:hypothetical protein